MMNPKKLRARQAGMLAKHHRVRPWDNVKRRDAKRGRDYIFSLYERGLSDQQIAAETGISVPGVAMYRVAVYLAYRERVTESREQSLQRQRIARIL